MSLLDQSLHRARQAFYKLDGPWYRRGIAEALGSKRYSRPALFGLDARLQELMPWAGGTFFEAGAHDGYTQSNTYFLERHRGWSGVLVEPVPELRAKCRRRRPRSRVFDCALVGPEHVGEEVSIHFGDLMSTIGDSEHAQGGLITAGRDAYSVSVPARTLRWVLEEAGMGALDLMILDLEGHEREVLSGDPLGDLAPRYMLLETLDRSAQQPGLDEALAGEYDFAQALSDYDLLYRRRD
jgi:FkbM family methyltransferase